MTRYDFLKTIGYTSDFEQCSNGLRVISLLVKFKENWARYDCLLARSREGRAGIERGGGVVSF